MSVLAGETRDGRPRAGFHDEVDGLIEEARARKARRLGGRPAWTAFFLGAGFVAAAVAAALLIPSERSPSPWLVAGLVLAYAVASRVEFEIGTGSAVPTQLVFVPMLFVLPLGTVPLLVAAGFVLGNLVQYLKGRIHVGRVPLPLLNAWHALGPVLVLGLAGESAPSWSQWPLYLAALGAQFAFDFASAAAYDWLGHGVAPREQARFAAWTNLVDVALSSVGLLVAFTAVEAPFAALLVLPLVGLLDLFARERRVRIDHALELSHAYRGTAFLLSDVVEADDAYTGLHSRDVVDLVVGVCDELALDGRDRREAEFVALLHDVGKIRIPDEIIKKAGALTAEERAIINMHTIEGQKMLESVGGLLGEVGRVVRSCHERYDGGGYPDGLAGEEIPLVARIVACCDAFSAMTTDRPYRAALCRSAAVAEIEANAGTQFDPVVARALVRIVTA